MKIRGISLISILSKQTTLIRIFCVWLALYCLANAGFNANAGEMIDARINIGLKLFRAIIAADANIKSKASEKGELPLLLLYKSNSFKAKRYVTSLLSLGKKNGRAQIKNIPLSVTSISYKDFLTDEKFRDTKVAGIFLLDRMSLDELKPISTYGISNQLIVFSPFDGDVEKNITAGLSIGARVRPVVNTKIINLSNIQIKPFFLKVAKKYEP